MSEQVGRNAQCPCGSGLKYKRCHGKGSEKKGLDFWQRNSKKLILGSLVAFVGLLTAGMVSGIGDNRGRLWSKEHRHWHNADNTEEDVGKPPPGPSSPNAQPGLAPEGKVWSPEHQHWHDKAPPAAAPGATAPAGTAPAGTAPDGATSGAAGSSAPAPVPVNSGGGTDAARGEDTAE